MKIQQKWHEIKMTKNTDNLTEKMKKKMDAFLWKKVTDTVKPLPSHRAFNFFSTNPYKSTKIPPDFSPKTEGFKKAFEAPFTISEKSISKSFTPKESLKHGDVNNLNRKHAKKFKSGKLDIDATLDLHGMTQSSAYERVFSFINISYDNGHRTVIIVTGKGKGVLQKAVPEWLNSYDLRDKILSFTYAQNHHGGSGALYVLLKRGRS